MNDWLLFGEDVYLIVNYVFARQSRNHENQIQLHCWFYEKLTVPLFHE